MDPAFSHAEAFPEVAHLISEIYNPTQDFVTHDELVDGLVNDPVGKRLIESAQEIRADGKSAEWWAGNIIAWFSPKIIEHQSEYETQFERTSKKPYAYKPAGSKQVKG